MGAERLRSCLGCRRVIERDWSATSAGSSGRGWCIGVRIKLGRGRRRCLTFRNATAEGHGRIATGTTGGQHHHRRTIDPTSDRCAGLGQGAPGRFDFGDLAGEDRALHTRHAIAGWQMHVPDQIDLRHDLAFVLFILQQSQLGRLSLDLTDPAHAVYRHFIDDLQVALQSALFRLQADHNLIVAFARLHWFAVERDGPQLRLGRKLHGQIGSLGLKQVTGRRLADTRFGHQRDQLGSLHDGRWQRTQVAASDGRGDTTCVGRRGIGAEQLPPLQARRVLRFRQLTHIDRTHFRLNIHIECRVAALDRYHLCLVSNLPRLHERQGKVTGGRFFNPLFEVDSQDHGADVSLGQQRRPGPYAVLRYLRRLLQLNSL